MPVVLSRIDDRLIHGQVTEGWGKYIKPDIILVVSDKVASSEWEKEICLAALPSNIKGEVVDIENSARRINELNESACKSYILFESPEDANDAIKNGAELKKLNVGGLHSSQGKREIIDYIFIDDNDTRHLQALENAGVELDFRDLPDHASFDVMALL